MEKVSKHKMRQPSNSLSQNDIVKFRTFNFMRNSAINEIGRLMREYGINMDDLKKNGLE